MCRKEVLSTLITANGGAVFRLNRDGSGYQVLHPFGAGANEGQNLQAGILIGTDGVLDLDVGGVAGRDDQVALVFAQGEDVVLP